MAETKTVSKPTLPKDIFAVDVNNHELLKLAYDSYLAKSRGQGGKTKTRGEVRGGGKKPWQQKGTGRARFGSIRNPIWTGGGIAFGPRGSANYTKQLNKKTKRVALRQALTLANKAKKIVITEPKTTGKTKEVVEFLAKQKSQGQRVLLVTDSKTPELIRATNNLPNVVLVSANYLSVFQILNADKIIVAPKALKVIVSWLKEEA